MTHTHYVLRITAQQDTDWNVKIMNAAVRRMNSN